jgi:hypothetical protein
MLKFIKISIITAMSAISLSSFANCQSELDTGQWVVEQRLKQAGEKRPSHTGELKIKQTSKKCEAVDSKGFSRSWTPGKLDALNPKTYTTNVPDAKNNNSNIMNLCILWQC